jgi:rhomboid protease GluP
MLKKLNYNSPVILTFSIISFFVLLLSLVTKGKTNILFFSVYRSSYLDPLTYIRIFTHVLGHSNLTHYVGNFMIILLIGPILEEKYGSKTLLNMIAITALLTGITNIIFFPTVLLGASGIAFMLILLGSFANIKKGTIPITLLFVVALYLGREVYDGLYAKDNISHIAHIVGGICGGIFGYIVAKE